MRKIVLAALLASPLLASAANLVTNGSFEANAMPNGSWSIFSNLTGWTGAPNIELRDNVAGAAYDGLNFVELDTTGNSGMFQDIATTAGAHYSLSFAYSPRPGTGNTNDINVLWNGSLVQALAGTNAGGANNWSVYTLDVVGGAGATSRLALTPLASATPTAARSMPCRSPAPCPSRRPTRCCSPGSVLYFSSRAAARSEPPSRCAPAPKGRHPADWPSQIRGRCLKVRCARGDSCGLFDSLDA